MDIDLLINLIKTIPKDKLSEDETIKTIINQAAAQLGKTYTDQELDQLVKMFKDFAQEKSQTSFISSLIKGGMTKSQLDSIKDKIDS